MGQHFLKSERVLGQIVGAAKIKKDETVLEIGPGTGVLTAELLRSDAKVIAIEKDVRAAELLKEKFEKEIGLGQLTLICDDVLRWDPSKERLTDGNYALVANIPYYITGAILEKFLECEPRPNRTILLVQKEVADRIIAKPRGNNGKSKESLLSISVKAFGEPRIVAKVPKGAFTPAPKVDSTVLEITNISDRRFKENSVDIGNFFKIVKAGFAHKRKMLIGNLKDVVAPERLKMIWETLALDEKIRAEDLGPDEWFQLVKGLWESNA